MLFSLASYDNNYVCHECIYGTKSGHGNPKFSAVLRVPVADLWPLSKFLNPPLVGLNNVDFLLTRNSCCKLFLNVVLFVCLFVCMFARSAIILYVASLKQFRLILLWSVY